MSLLEQTTRVDVPVPFTGLDADAGPLAWGQQGIWRDIQESGLGLCLSVVRTLPDGTTVEDRTAHVASLVSRLQALRVRLETDGEGNPCQIAPSSGHAELEVFHIPDDTGDDEALEYAEQVMRLRRDSPFDPCRDPLFRVSLVSRGGVLLYEACTCSHLIVDGVTFARLFRSLNPARARDVPELTGPRPAGILDLARRERTAALRRTSDRSMRYWEKQLRSAPALTFGPPTHPEGRQGHRYWHGRFNSPAVHLAMLAIADRTGTDTSTVLHAIMATAVARATGVNPLTTKINVSNRFRRELSEIFAPVSQNSVITIDAADATLDEVVARTRTALLAAGMFGYYDPRAADELVARVGAERGQPVRISCLINDARVARLAPADAEAARAPVTMEQIKDKLPESFLVWDGTLDSFHDQLWISVLDYPETVWLQVIIDMACFTEAEAEAALRAVEEVAVEAVLDPGAPTRVSRSLAPG
jgi:Condensation domain